MIRMIDNTLTPISSPVAVKDQLGSYYHDKWERAHTLFPKRNFPWDVLPQKIADSLQQLARSCASSSNALPGAAIAIFASVLGSTISISPKESWEEPLIFWFADIRGSGQGKTPSTRALRKVLNDAQKLEDLAYSKPCCQDESDQALDVEPVSPRPRGYFMTDFTLEGLRKELLGSPHGGIVCIMNELSSIITLQNQYKGKGNDRESLIGLHDGDPVRVIRADGADTIEGSRVSIFGGIQPEVWKRIFGGEKGLYTVDGTVFRFLPTYEPNYFHELTSETWSPKNEAAWKSLVTSALAWGNVRVSTKDWEPLILSFDEEAQARFIDWRNDLFGYKAELPAIINGFMPKCVGHAVRLAGVLNCIEQFSNGKMPGSVLTKHDVEKGIKVALFYMGHAVEAIKTLAIDVFEPRVEVSDHGIYLAQTLESLRPDIDSGKLTVGYIHEKFNEISMPDLHIKTSRAMGSLLRSFGLTILPGKSQANGRSGVKCLSWDALTEKFLKHVHNVLEVRKTSDGASSDLMTSDEECLECPADDYSREDIRDMFEGMSMTKDDGSEPLEGHKGLSGHVSITPQVEDESVIAHEAI